VVEEGGVIKIVAPDEAEEGPPPPPAEPAPPAMALAVPLRPVLAPAAAADPAALQEAADVLFDSEDPVELVEKLRQLFRAATRAGLDPLPLLKCALRRGHRALSHEVGSLVRHHLDRDTGRALEDLCGEEAPRVRDAVHFLLAVREDAPLAPLVLPALTRVAGDPLALRPVLAALPQAVALVPADPDVVEAFLDPILDQLVELESPERFTLSRFLIRIHDRCATLPEYLYRRLRATVDVQVQAFYGNVLARMRLASDLRERLTRSLVDLFWSHANDVALAERLKVTFLYLGPRPLALLTESVGSAATLMQRSYLVDLWISYLASGAETPPPESLAAFLASEIAARNRAALLGMIRSSAASGGKVALLELPALIHHVMDQPWLKASVIAVLLEEAVQLEDPDDLAAMAFLARLGREAVEAAFERAREEAALDSRAAPYRFRVFAWLAAHTDAEDWLAEMIDIALGWPFLRRQDLPVTLVGLGFLSRAPNIDESHLLDILDRLLPQGSAPPTPAAVGMGLSSEGEEVNFAPARMRAALDMYGGRTCPENVRVRIEEKLESIVGAAAPPRALLVAALDALDALMDREDPPLRVEAIGVLLARMVLKKSRETSLEHVLEDMLKEETEGHGVRVPEAWSKEERDRALVILGKTAAHPRVPESLHRMVSARLAGFLEDWLDAHERGRDLYLHRDTPLWRVLVDVVERRPTEWSIEALVRIGVRTLEVARRAPAALGLERREDVQRLLVCLIWLAPEHPLEVRGSLSIDVPKTALQTLMTLATRESESAMRVLTESVEHVPPRIRPQLEAFLQFHRGRVGDP
jgi:hypothetical protein